MQYNVNNPAVKRILREVKEMEAEPSDQYHANPLEDNIFEWHFTIRGPKDTEFEGGLYHGRIILPPEYPFKPPNIVLLNESGRFEVGTKICLSISSYHPEHWQPSWSIRTVLVALISFMPTKGDGAIGAIDMPAKDRKVLALKTPSFVCNKCGKKMSDILTPVEIGAKTENTSEEPANTTTTTTTTTTSTEYTPTPSDTTTATTTSPPSTPTTTSTTSTNDFQNQAPIFVPQPSPTQPLAPPAAISQPISQPISPPISPPISQPIPQPFLQPAPTAQPAFTQPAVPRPAPPQPQIIRQQVQTVTTTNASSDTTNIDYIIIALLVAIVGLLAKKFYGL